MPENKREPKLPLRRPCADRSGLNGLAFAVAESKAGQSEAKQCERARFGHAKSAVGARILKYQILEKAPGAFRGSSRDCPSAPPLRSRPVASGPGWLALSSLLIDNRNMTIDRAVERKALHPPGGKPSGDLQYWLAQPVQARLAAVEELRRQMAGYDAQPRLQRVCRITQRKQG